MSTSPSKSNAFEPRCHVCQLGDRQRIFADAELLNPATSVNQLARLLDVSRDSLYLHRRKHLDPALAAAALDRFELSLGTMVLERLLMLLDVTEVTIEHAEHSGNTRETLSAVETARRILGSLSRIDDRNRSANFIAPAAGSESTELGVLAEVMLEALELHPDAREPIAAALAELEHR